MTKYHSKVRDNTAIVDLILFNAIAKRRRSPSDTFLDNSLGILKTYIEEQGFRVEVTDWACTDCWEEITPKYLVGINRFFTVVLLNSSNQKDMLKKVITKFLLPFFLISQELTSAAQSLALEKKINLFVKSLGESGCKVLGIKTWYGDSFLTAKTLAKIVKENSPEVLIVAGGPHPSIYREEILEDSGFDIAIVGEGEKALTVILALARQSNTKEELLKKIAYETSQGNLKNIIYRNGGEITASNTDTDDANKKVIPSYNNFNGKTLIHVVVDSIGCPWGKCNFCVHSCIYPCYSLRNPQLIVDEIEVMISKGIGLFRFSGSSSSLEHVKKIAQLIKERNIKINFSMFARSEKNTSEKIAYSKLVDGYRLLLCSGLRAVFIGGEAADDFILQHVMNKGVTVYDIVATINAMREASSKEKISLDIGLSLIYPTPTLGRMSLKELKAANIELVKKTNPDSVLVNPPAPFPGTLWNRESKRFGFELDDSFARNMLGYDYVLYKPPFLWPDIHVTLEDMSFKQILNECQDMRKSIEKEGFITEVTDEQFLMLRSAGYEGREGVKKFKQETLLDILSCDYRRIKLIEKKVNRVSRTIALGS